MNRKKKKEKQNMVRINKAGVIVGAVTAIIGAGISVFVLFRDTHPSYAYETEFNWMHMDEIGSYLGSRSKVEIYKTKGSDGAFHQGALLAVLYNNLDEQERAITRFTVHAENITEDYSPYLNFYEARFLGYHISNSGWSETGALQIEFLELVPADGYEAQKDVQLSLKGSDKVWQLNSIKPGESTEIQLLTEEDFHVEYSENFQGVIPYTIRFKVEAPESGYSNVIASTIEVYPDHLQLFSGGIGDGEQVNYVIMIDTSYSSWSETYKVYQTLPGKRTTQLPVFIAPSMSCTMDVRFEFETLDGEIIEAAPLEDARFIVPYYETPDSYIIDGEFLDWDTIDGQAVVYFPFGSSK